MTRLEEIRALDRIDKMTFHHSELPQTRTESRSSGSSSVRVRFDFALWCLQTTYIYILSRCYLIDHNSALYFIEFLM